MSVGASRSATESVRRGGRAKQFAHMVDPRPCTHPAYKGLLSNGSLSMPLSPYQSWDLTSPIIPPRTRLVPLEPIGVGTAYIESLTSYTCRLAHVHSITVGKLFNHEIGPMINKLYLASAHKRTNGNFCKNYFTNRGHMFNGVGKCAEDLVLALQALTLRQDLRFLTYLTWTEVLSEIGLLRRTRAWCPLCFGEWLCEGREIYEPLLWRLHEVTVCPLHRRELETGCPKCGRHLRLIESHSRAGHCQRCDAWLGKTGTEMIERRPRTEDFNFRLWSALELGHLIAAGPTLSVEPGRKQIAMAIKVCTERLAAGNAHVFARLSGLPKNRAHFWIRRNTVPLLNSLLKICHKMCISLVDFLTLEDPLTHQGIAGVAIRLEAEKVTIHKRRKARAVMREALSENPAPSIQEIARRLGYKSMCSLRKVSPKLYLRLVKRHRNAVGCKSVRQGFRGASLHTKEQVSRALQAALFIDPAITLRQVAIELGYANGDGALSKRFPELCQALVKRRQESFTKRHQEQERALRQVIRENPPPPLREVETRLGYKNGSSLRKRFPQLGAVILANHKAYRRRQAAELLARLQSVLMEGEPPSLASAARRFDQERNSVRKQFPDVCREIKERHAEFTRSQAARTRGMCEEEIRRLTADLHAEGKHPTMILVKSRMTRPDYLNYVKFWAILCDEKKRLAIN